MGSEGSSPGLTPQEKADLLEMQAQLLGASQSPWEPRCVARAFHGRVADHAFVFTMQAWIDLDYAQSPFLMGKLPMAEEAVLRFEEAFAAFGHHSTTPASCDPEGLILLGRKMIGAIERGFAMRLRMRPPEGFKTSGGDDGFGEWLPVMACLKAQLHFAWGDALALPVKQAFGLIHAHRRNEGWTVVSGNYALRDAGEK